MVKTIVLSNDGKKSNPNLDTKLSHIVVCHMIEGVYDAILAHEAAIRTLITEDITRDEVDKIISVAREAVFASLMCDREVSFTLPHPTPSLLLFTKGKRMVNRVLGILSEEETTLFFYTLFNRIECLDVCHVSLGRSDKSVL